jgi:hypothetical protein
VGIGTSSPSQKLVTETTDGLISIAPTGWRATARATVLIRTKTNNPAELDFQNTVSGLNYGWQISSRDGTTPNFNFYSNSNGTFLPRVSFTSAGNVGIATETPKVRLSGRVLSINGDLSGENYQASIELLNNSASAGEIWTNLDEMVIGAFGSGRPLSFRVQNETRGQFDTSGNFRFNSGYGDIAIAYGCRAWVNFNGTGTVAIRGQGNVSSITDNGTGDYTVNFTRSMPDVNYCVGLTADFAQQMVKSANTFGGSGTNPTTSSIRVFTRDGGSSASDASHVYVSIFR